MFEKIKVARQMRKFIYSSRNNKLKKLYWKCYRAYVYNSVIMRKDEFKIKFGSEYYDSFVLRIKDWVEYICDNIYTIFWRIIPYKKHIPNRAKYYIKYGVSKPVHIKFHEHVNESALEYFLYENGLEIAGEYLTSLESIYYIKQR